MDARVAEASGDAIGGVGVPRDDLGFVGNGELETGEGFAQAVCVLRHLLEKGG